MSPDRVPAQYRGIKRIQQACSNCRRKKAKCSGQRPVCESCRRLAQDCQWGSSRGGRYTPDAQPDLTTSASDTDNNSGYSDGLSTKVAAIEMKLDNLVSSLNAFLPIMMNQNSISSLSNPSIQMSNETGLQSGRSLLNNPPASLGANTSSLTELPPPQILSSLVDIYFARVHNQPYSFFHEQSFRQRLADDLLPDYLKFAVIASALRFSEDPYFNGAYHEASASYAKESWRQIVSVWFAPETDPDIHICQAITLLSIIDYTTGRRHPSWLKIGLSIRIAQDLRLMMEPDPNLSYADQEERRRVFWSVYILDKLCSCARGRPAALADIHCRVQLPCDEEAFRNGEPKKTPTLKQILSSTKIDGDGPSDLALVVLTASIIGRCAQYSIHEYTRGESQLPPWDSKSEFATIYSFLLQLETQFELGNGIVDALTKDCVRNGEIDMQLAGPVIFSHALFHTCQCLLHHPLLLHQQCKARGIKAPQSFTNRALQTCRENACAMSQLLQDVKASGCVAFFSFIGFCTTVACSVHTMYVNDKDSSIRQQALHYLQSDMLFLREFSHHWKHGIQMCKIIESLCGQSSSSASLVFSPARLEDLQEDQLENVWAAIDYGTQSEQSSTSTNNAANAISPEWNSVLEADMSAFDRDVFLGQSQSQINGSSPYNSMIFDGMSPLAAFFGNGLVGENFGG